MAYRYFLRWRDQSSSPMAILFVKSLRSLPCTADRELITLMCEKAWRHSPSLSRLSTLIKGEMVEANTQGPKTGISLPGRTTFERFAMRSKSESQLSLAIHSEDWWHWPMPRNFQSILVNSFFMQLPLVLN